MNKIRTTSRNPLSDVNIKTIEANIIPVVTRVIAIMGKQIMKGIITNMTTALSKVAAL